MKKLNIKITVYLIAILSLVGTMFITPNKVDASQINVPVITSFAPSDKEDNALKLEVNLNNTPVADYSIMAWNVTNGNKYNLACDPSNGVCTYTFQGLDEGTEYKVKVFAIMNEGNWVQSNYSETKTATAHPLPSLECPEGQEIDEETNTCVDIPDEEECPEGQEWNTETKTCVTPIQCNDDETLNEETNQCEKNDEECPEGQELQEQEDGTEKCVAVEPEECEDGEQWNSTTKECEEIPVVLGDLGSITLSPTSYKYNGKKKTPSATVTDKNSKKLTKGTDYSLKYSSSTRKNVGWYTVTATGKGDYQGSAKAGFKIKPIATKITSLTKPSNTKIKVVLKNKKGGMKYEIQYKKAINSSWTSKKTSSTSATISVSAGTKYKVRARTYKAKSGETTMTSSWSASKTVTTGGKAKLAKATLSTTSYTYNGEVKKPSVTVVDTTNKKVATKYYSVSYPSGRKAVGTYTVTVKGKGNYSGKTLKPTFTINPPNGTIASAVKNNEKMTVTINPASMSGLSYEVWYKKSTDTDGENNANWKSSGLKTGTSFEITGLEKGVAYDVKVRSYISKSGTSYYSTWSVQNTIKDGEGTGTDIGSKGLSLTVNTLKYNYNGSAKTPSVTVVDVKSGKTLVVNTDYSISYQNNKNVGTASVTVTGKGSYVGTATGTFEIVPNSTTISKQSVTKNSIKVGIASNKSNKKDSGIKYRIGYYASSDNSSMPNPVPSVTAGVTASAKTISNLTAGTSYTLIIQAYKVVNGVEYTSDWSSPITIKTSSSTTSKKTTKVTGLPNTKSLKKGKSYTETAVLTPSNSTSDVTWSSSKTSVAKVTRNSSNHKKATIKCLKKGTATITAKSNGKTDKTKLTCKS